MKRNIWQHVDTVRFGTRHMPVETLARLDQVAAWFGRGVTQEMILAVAVEYGLSTLQNQLLTLSRGEAVEQLMRDFRLLFGK